MIPLQNNDPDEQEARRKRRFLEDGAEVTLTPLRLYPEVARALPAPSPVTVELPETGDLTERLALEPDAELVVALDFGHLARTPDFSIMVFLNNPRATARTPVTEPGFIGTLAFFHEGAHGDDDSIVFRLPARQAVAQSPARGPATITMVPLAHPGRGITAQSLDVTATAEIVRSEVG